MSTRGPITTTSGWDHPNGRHLSAKEHDTIRKLVEAGYSHRDIAIKMGRGASTIGRAARGMGIMPAQAKRSWTAQEDARLIHLLNDGRSQQEIADELHRNKPAISYRLWFLRQHQEVDVEIRYQVLPDRQEPMSADPGTGAAKVTTPALLGRKGAKRLPRDRDLWSTWQFLVFGVTNP